MLKLVEKTSGYTYGHSAPLFFHFPKNFTVKNLEFVLEKTYT